MSASNSAPPAEHLDFGALQSLLDAVPDAVSFKDAEGRFLRVNQAQCRLLGMDDPMRVLGRTDFDFIIEEHARRDSTHEQVVLRTGQRIDDKLRLVRFLDGRELRLETSWMPWRDSDGETVGLLALTRTNVEGARAEDKAEEERNLLHQIIDLLPSRVYVKDCQSRYVINNRAHLRSLGVARQEDALGRTTADFHSPERAAQALADDRQVLETGLRVLDQEKSDFGPEGQTRWSLTAKVPLRDVRGGIVGLVGISHDITERKRTEEELRLRSAQMEADLQLARRTQEALLPAEYPAFPRGVPPEQRTLCFAHRYLATATLGGDFLDVIRVSDTEAALIVGDVMGHGVRAGLVTALIRGLMEEIHEIAKDPGAFLQELNHRLFPILRQSGLPGFVTMVHAVIDTAAGEFRWASAGHPPGLHLRRAVGLVERLTCVDPEPAAGLIENFTYSTRRRPFAAGDALLFFTDGLFEASGDLGAMLGEEGLHQLVERLLALPGEQLLDRLLDELRRFTQRNDFEDDICVLLAEATGVPVNLPLNYEI